MEMRILSIHCKSTAKPRLDNISNDTEADQIPKMPKDGEHAEDAEDAEADQAVYQSLVGSLMYAAR
jgi:hypothetical protein